jgi:hypothetical protein
MLLLNLRKDDSLAAVDARAMLVLSIQLYPIHTTFKPTVQQTEAIIHR